MGDRVRESDKTLVSYGCCSEGDEFLVRFHHKRRRAARGMYIRRSAYEMTDLLWEHYQDMLEQEETGYVSDRAAALCYCSANW